MYSYTCTLYHCVWCMVNSMRAISTVKIDCYCILEVLYFQKHDNLDQTLLNLTYTKFNHATLTAIIDAIHEKLYN
jgi:hypothetical protein